MRRVLSVLLASIVAAGAGPPASAAPRLGTQFRLSDVGGLGDPAFEATGAAVAYNSQDDEFLVVWAGDDPIGGMVDEEYEIFGQRYDASTGAPIGPNDFRISDMGGTGNPSFDAIHLDVAYNPQRNEYLVVWTGDDDLGGLVDDEWEVFGQRLSAAGAPVGANDFRISAMGGTGDFRYRASFPAVVHNDLDDQYLVVWQGDHDAGGLVDDENEIFGQRLAGDGAAIGADDFRISEVGGTGDATFDAFTPDVAHDSLNDRYLVVWTADDDFLSQVDGEFEILGQRLDATGAQVGADDFTISDMGPPGDTRYAAQRASVTYNAEPEVDEFLVVWQGDDDRGDLVDNEFEIFGQRVLSGGGEVGFNDFRISQVGADGVPTIVALAPEVAWDPLGGGYLVVWYGDDDVGGRVGDEYEVEGQRLDAQGAPVGADDFRISVMGGTGDPDFDAFQPALAFGGPSGSSLVAWEADHPLGGTVDGEFETYGVRVELPFFDDGFESGDASAWSAAIP